VYFVVPEARGRLVEDFCRRKADPGDHLPIEGAAVDQLQKRIESPAAHEAKVADIRSDVLRPDFVDQPVEG
jgi:hypothetical protein